MFSNADQMLTVDQVKALLGPPPVMPGESAEEYMNWWEAFVEPDKPKTFMAWLEINELAHKEWEQKRLRGYRSAIVKDALITTLFSILAFRFESLVPRVSSAMTLEIARDYYGSDITARGKARAIVASHDVSEEQIAAKAMARRGEEMLVLDRMDVNRANTSRHLRKAIDRRADASRNSPEPTGDQV